MVPPQLSPPQRGGSLHSSSSGQELFSPVLLNSVLSLHSTLRKSPTSSVTSVSQHRVLLTPSLKYVHKRLVLTAHTPLLLISCPPVPHNAPPHCILLSSQHRSRVFLLTQGQYCSNPKPSLIAHLTQHQKKVFK